MFLQLDPTSQPVPIPKRLDPNLAFPIIPLIRVITDNGRYIATYQSDTSNLKEKDKTAQGQAIKSYGGRSNTTILTFDFELTIPVLAAGASPYTSVFYNQLGRIDNNVFIKAEILSIPDEFKAFYVLVSVESQNGEPTVIDFPKLSLTFLTIETIVMRLVEERTYSTIQKSLVADEVNTVKISLLNADYAYST